MQDFGKCDAEKLISMLNAFCRAQVKKESCEPDGCEFCQVNKTITLVEETYQLNEQI